MSLDASLNFRDRFSAIRQNDEKALKELYLSNYPTIEKYVLDNTGTVEEAKDIFQEAFISLWRNIQLGRFEPQHDKSIDAYLFRIAKNKWLDHLRSVKRNQTIALTDENDAAGEIQELNGKEQEHVKNVAQLFKQLGSVCKDLLERFYFHRQSMRVIADKLDWTEATARNNKYRCLQQLRKLVNDKNSNHG